MGIGRDLRFALGLVRGKPYDVVIQVTNRCNMKCSFCQFWCNCAPVGEELSLEELRRVADQLAQLGCFMVSLEGGEPLLRNDIVEIVRIFAGRHMPILFTNGWFVTAEKAKALFDAGLSHAIVALDYPDERHDEKRGLPGAMRQARRAVDLLRDAAPRGGKSVMLMTIIMESNWRDFETMARISASHGVGHCVTLLSAKKYPRGVGRDRLPPPKSGDHFLNVWHRYSHIRTFRDYMAGIKSYLTGGTMPVCRAGIQSFNIDHVGNVFHCIEQVTDPVGNVRRDSLLDIHRRLVAKRRVVSRCQECWTACRSALNTTGNGGVIAAWRDILLRMSAV